MVEEEIDYCIQIFQMEKQSSVVNNDANYEKWLPCIPLERKGKINSLAISYLQDFIFLQLLVGIIFCHLFFY